MMPKLWLLMFVLVLVIPVNDAGPITYAACQAVCAAAVCACYASAGFVFGTVTAGVGTPAAVLACNAAFSQCSAACAAMLLVPAP